MGTIWRWLLAFTLALSLAPATSALAAPNARYFPATGHWVTGDFLTFFDRHGGLDIFGYPRTEVLSTNGRLVQYFQRARLESWPENPPPYNVQLMLIGDAVLGPADPPIPASQVPAAGDLSRTYFPQTGHTLSGPFRDFFRAHGGLDIFGYPTSEAAMGPDGFVVQRFQRARFELHPELPADYRVSLGLLGDEYIFVAGKVPLVATQPVSGDAPPTVVQQAVASSGGQLVFQTKPGGELIVANLDGSGAHVVGHGLDPRWSPDGTKLAFAVWGTTPGIYVANADGSRAQLVYAGPDARAPVWSPDGHQIAFYRRYDGFKSVNGTWFHDDFFQVVVVRLSDHTTWLPPGQPYHSYSPSWSPDGTTLVFSGDLGLYLVTASQIARLIPNTDYHFTTPTWSPDGRQTAVTLWNHDHWDIATINPDGSGLQMLTATPGMAGPPANNAAAVWSPRGDRLAFVSDRSGSWNLYIMNRDGSSAVPVGTMPLAYTGGYDRTVDWKS